MATELVNSATSEKLTEMDWMKNIEICELVANDQRQARDVIKAVKKRLGSKNSMTQLFAVMLLEMLMNNIGEHVHRQVIDTGLLPLLVKIVKKKSDLPVREKIFLLLDATQTSLGGASGSSLNIIMHTTIWCVPRTRCGGGGVVKGDDNEDGGVVIMLVVEVVFSVVMVVVVKMLACSRVVDCRSLLILTASAGVQFPQGPRAIPSNHPTPEANRNSSPGGEHDPSKHEAVVQQAEPQIVPESSIIRKAGTALEVLREVLDAVDSQHPEGAKDEFTLDLVEQCSFQKQRVMHLVMTSRDEKVVSRAIELNEQLHQVLARHDALLSGRTTSTANHFVHQEAEEEEEAEQLFRRMRKGKACAQPEDEEHLERPLGLLGSSIPGERLHRPLIRPLSLDPPHESRAPPPAVVIPPPPAKHVEREKFFQENKVDGSAVAGHMRGLSIHSRNASSSNSGSMDSSD
ncbi:hypothetical protein L1049_019251 [Liquidambar formosana]|uniref:Target of Myb protein 1 n=1 Tax=Liquidambar formosana TaxID=63359 RepID=A0AAP0S5C8_LIQFO